jgi:hypothetical protein
MDLLVEEAINLLRDARKRFPVANESAGAAFVIGSAP